MQARDSTQVFNVGSNDAELTSFLLEERILEPTLSAFQILAKLCGKGGLPWLDKVGDSPIQIAMIFRVSHEEDINCGWRLQQEQNMIMM